MKDEHLALMQGIEKDMDAGRIPFVLDKFNGRWPTLSKVLAELGLTTGQTVTNTELSQVVRGTLTTAAATANAPASKPRL